MRARFYRAFVVLPRIQTQSIYPGLLPDLDSPADALSTFTNVKPEVVRHVVSKVNRNEMRSDAPMKKDSYLLAHRNNPVCVRVLAGKRSMQLARVRDWWDIRRNVHRGICEGTCMIVSRLRSEN